MAPVSKKAKKVVKKADTIEKDEELEDVNVVSAQLQKKIDRKAKGRKKRPERGVVLVRHLPHGFFEDQLKQYFEQFGLVTRLRLARSRKTGGVKGFAFVEFAIPEVAKIAADTMSNYLMFKKIVQAHYIPPEEQKYNYFKSKIKKVTTPLDKEIYISGKTKLACYKVKQNNIWNQYNYEKRTKNNLKRINKLKKKHADLDFDFDEVTIAPNLLPAKLHINNDDTEKPDNKTENNSQHSDDYEAGSLLLIKKRKRNTSAETANVNLKKQQITTVKGQLKQLLDKTLEEESSSEDEDYIPDNSLKIESDDSDESDKSSIVEEKNIEVVSTDDDDEEPENIISLKKHVGKARKPQKANLEKIARRTPHLGGIQKKKRVILKSKPTKNTIVNPAKDKIKGVAAKEIVKSNKVQKLKKIDLKKKKQK